MEPKELSARSLQYYVIVRRWASDLEFFKIEKGFFRRLLEGSFVRVSNKDHTKNLDKIEKSLLKFEDNKSMVAKMLEEQMKSLERAAKDDIPEDIEQLAWKQINLEYLMSNLTREFQSVKRDVFALVDEIMEEQKIILG